MPEQFDPAWEYWAPDPEIVEAMAVPKPSRFDGLAQTDEYLRIDQLGFRLGRAQPDHYMPAQAPYWEEPWEDVAVDPAWRLRECRVCAEPFRVLSKGQFYCGRSCGATKSPQCQRTLPDAVCLNPLCKRTFRVRNDGQKYCCTACRTPPNQKLPPERFMKLVLAGHSYAEIAREYGVDRSACCKMANRLGLPKRSAEHAQPATKDDSLLEAPAAGAGTQPTDADADSGS